MGHSARQFERKSASKCYIIYRRHSNNWPDVIETTLIEHNNWVSGRVPLNWLPRMCAWDWTHSNLNRIEQAIVIGRDESDLLAHNNIGDHAIGISIYGFVAQYEKMYLYIICTKISTKAGASGKKVYTKWLDKLAQFEVRPVTTAIDCFSGPMFIIDTEMLHYSESNNNNNITSSTTNKAVHTAIKKILPHQNVEPGICSKLSSDFAVFATEWCLCRKDPSSSWNVQRVGHVCMRMTPLCKGDRTASAKTGV